MSFRDRRSHQQTKDVADQIKALQDELHQHKIDDIQALTRIETKLNDLLEQLK
jgi:hypothetical protein